MVAEEMRGAWRKRIVSGAEVETSPKTCRNSLS